MRTTRRDFFQLGVSGLAVATVAPKMAAADVGLTVGTRQLHFVQVDVFSAKRLQGNPLVVFPDARGLTDAQMQDIARETNLSETTFVFPRDASVEREQGVKVRIFTPEAEVPFGGHPTLGTAMVLHECGAATNQTAAGSGQITLDLKVGRIPVVFTNDASGQPFGEMSQVEPVFGPIHDRATVAALVGLRPADIGEEGPIQTISTGLPFAIVPLKKLKTLQSLRPDMQKIRSYFEREREPTDFYYITRDTTDPSLGLRSRGLYVTGEDPATGSAAGCTVSWMVRYGVAKPGQTLHIEQGVEIQRPSQIFARADRQGEKVLNVRVGGNTVEIAKGEFSI